MPRTRFTLTALLTLSLTVALTPTAAEAHPQHRPAVLDLENLTGP